MLRHQRRFEDGPTPLAIEGSKARPLGSTDHAGKLVGECDPQHVVVQSPLGGFDPGFEPLAFL